MPTDTGATRLPPVDAASGPALAVEGLCFAYGGVCALRDVSFELERGTFTALLGPNGAGKSTLFSLILRLLPPQSGVIRVDGHDTRRFPSAALASIGIVFQEPTLDLDLSVRQNLSYFGALRSMGGDALRLRIEAGLSASGLADSVDRRVRTLSSGQRRRIEIVRAMLHAPRLLLLDEATTGLDIPARRAILARVRALCREDGVSVLWATHLIDEVEASDRVIVLHSGEVAASGAVAEVVARAGAQDIAGAYHSLTFASEGIAQ